MKKLMALSIASLMFAATQASALCLNLTDRYSGTVPANSEVIAYGPITITAQNGCSMANIASTISALGAGPAPILYIDRLVGSTWVQVAGNTGKNASTLGQLGTYRIRHVNTYSVSLGYSGTTKYNL
ncbi:hypothetical protein [Pseudomonas capsici]|uniref:hypothetical protein n=1 Tax=Pseudomonas capsici TaxID=2810614 RepID=UPI0021F1CB7D|nr:hypothetical protein [Pseudomonas capsici]MCV4341946.1 hypothetical protein [Pseudomonas capsici]